MARVQMYTTTWCGYCVRAKALLDGKGVEYEEINLDDDPRFRQKLLELTGGWTVPQILIDGEAIGGYAELWRLDKSGTLGQRWQPGQNHVPRPARRVFSIGARQRGQGSPSRPYTLNSCCMEPTAPSGVR